MNNYMSKEEVKVSHAQMTKQPTQDLSDDENLVEPEDQRAFPKFLQNIPGVTATDSMGYRIEALRVYLENILSDIPFLAAYKHLVVTLNFI